MKLKFQDNSKDIQKSIKHNQPKQILIGIALISQKRTNTFQYQSIINRLNNTFFTQTDEQS